MAKRSTRQTVVDAAELCGEEVDVADHSRCGRVAEGVGVTLSSGAMKLLCYC